jgi:hypothetical protein
VQRQVSKRCVFQKNVRRAPSTATLESRGTTNAFSDIHGAMQLVSFKLNSGLDGIEITKVRCTSRYVNLDKLPMIHFLFQW